MLLPQLTSRGIYIYGKWTAYIRGYKLEILDILDALRKQETVSIIHCTEYQKGNDSVGNNHSRSSGSRSGYAGAYPGYGPARDTHWEMGVD